MACALTLIVAPPANAGTAVVYQCRTGSRDAYVDLVSVTGNAGITANLAQCATGGAYLLSSGDAGADPGPMDRTFTFTAPRSTTFVGGFLHRQMDAYAFRAGGAPDSWGFGYTLTDDAGAIVEHCGHTADAPSIGNCGPAFASVVPSQSTVFADGTTWLPTSPSKSYSMTVGCAVGGGHCHHDFPHPGVNQISVAFLVRDDDAPTGATATGRLATADPIRAGDTAVTVSASDPGGLGVFRTDFLVDGQVVGGGDIFTDNGGNCVDPEPSNGNPYEWLTGTPCLVTPPSRTFTATGLPEGRHRVQVRVLDAAGNATIAMDRDVTIDLVPAPSNTAGPTVSGTAAVGRTMTSDTGSWDVHGAPAPAYSYAWQRCAPDGGGCVDIAGATSALYDVSSADAGTRLRSRVTATNTEGATSAASGMSDVVPAPVVDNGGSQGGSDNGGTNGGGSTTGGGSTNGGGTSNGGGSAAGGGGGATGPVATTPGLTDTALPETRPLGTPNGENAGENVRLAAYELGSERRSIRTRYGRTFTISGRLQTADGRPISGARLEVLSKENRTGAQLASEQAILTAADGSFRYVGMPGPSRMIRIGYHARVGDTTFARTTDVMVRVVASVSFRLSRKALHNGQTLRYLGRVLGPRTGHRFVEVQVRNGRKWQIVCSVRTESNGSFACAHRFRRTVVRTTYTFRARVRKQPALPYEAAVSVTRKARVAP